MTEDTTIRLYDGERELVCEGCVIGESSSEVDDRPDWTEIKIIRTVAGSYVVNIIGRTRRHNGWEKHRTHVSVAPEGAVESLYLIDDDGVRYMTNIAKQAAASAADADPVFAQAYLVEHVA